MATGTSSARYEDLYHYARTAEAVDQELIAQADKLIIRLSNFEATCEELAFRVSSDGLGSALRSHGTRAIPVEQQVLKVGEAFQKADRQANSFIGRVALDPVGRWVFKAFRPVTLAMADSDLGLDFVYIVKKGDTLSEIVKRFGIKVDDILRENQIPNPDLIQPGLTLVIPDAQPVQKHEPVSIPVPIPRPAPQLPSTFESTPDKPGWLFERIKSWLEQFIEKDAPQTKLGEGADSNSGRTKLDEMLKVPHAEDIPNTIEVPHAYDASKTQIEQGYYTPYFRGDGVTKSNCVWYAATALTVYTAGKIDLHAVHDDDRMGMAYNWPTEARQAIDEKDHPLHGLITEINNKPRAGTVITFDPGKGGALSEGHVAWVEEAELVLGTDGKKYWSIVISEENYGGNGWPGATEIDAGDPNVKRWRRPITFPADDTDESNIVADGINFIHWDPNYEKEAVI